MTDVAALGLDNNTTLYYALEQFYTEAGEGVEVLLYNLPGTVISSVEQGAIDSIMRMSGGRCRGIFFVDAIVERDAEQVYKTLDKAQGEVDSTSSDIYAPAFVVFSGVGYAADFRTKNYNRLAVFEGTEDGDESTSLIGLLAGRLASVPVHRNVGRVKDGPLNYSGEIYVNGETLQGIGYTEDHHDKGFITPRTYVGLSGYYFADDCMACDPTDDYAHLTARRTVDKAYRIAYRTLVQYMLDEIEVNEDGTMQTGVLKSWQQTVENAINREMTAKGELSDSDGEGCVCFIDPTQNVLSTSRIELTLKVRPYGYARYIDVNLGFQVSA